MRPRIRTIKPEVWQDEHVGELSLPARLLFIGLITMADDEGRLRELGTAISGHVFPYDQVSTRRLDGWLAEIAAAGIIVRYEVGGHAYIAFPHWSRHQRVDRPSESLLPTPPNSTNVRDRLDESSRSPRASASLPDPDPDPSVVNGSGQPQDDARTSKRVDQNELPADFPVDRLGLADDVLALLLAVQMERGGNVPTRRGVGLALLAYPGRDHAGVARQLQHWALAGTGQSRAIKDHVRTYRTFLEREPDAAPTRNGNGGGNRGNWRDAARPATARRDALIQHD